MNGTYLFIGLLALWLTNLHKLSVHQKNMMKYKTGTLHYAIKKDKIQYDNNSGSNSNHIGIYISREL